MIKIKILIVSGVGDYTEYIHHHGIGLNFYRFGNTLDTMHHSKIETEIQYAYLEAKQSNKGLCFSTQRYEIINTIYDYFKDKEDEVEFIRVERDNNVCVFDKNSLGVALNYQIEIR